MLLVTFASIALDFQRSQKCFTKAVYALAPFSRQGQLRHRKVEWLAQVKVRTKVPSFLFPDRISEPRISIQSASGKKKKDLSGFSWEDTMEAGRENWNWNQKMIITFFPFWPSFLQGKDTLFIALEVDLEEPNSTSDINCFIILKTLEDCESKWMRDFCSRLRRKIVHKIGLNFIWKTMWSCFF